MRQNDLAEYIQTVTIKMPPIHGPGSGKDSWIVYAHRVAEANGSLTFVIERLAEIIKELELQKAALTKRIEEVQQRVSGKPKGGRAKLPDETVKRIEEALLAGGRTRQIGARFKVSAMTVSRVRKDMNARLAQFA